MFIAAATVSSLFAALLVYSAARKLSHEPGVVESYARAGVPEQRLNLLAAVILVGAAGLVAGLAWAPLGVAAAGALSVYFLAAIGSHLLAGDAANIPVPATMLALAIAALVLRLGSL